MKHPTLAVTNPILLRLFAQGWEEIVGPLGPITEGPATQIAVALAVHELASTIADTDVRRQIQSSAGKVLVDQSRALAGQE